MTKLTMETSGATVTTTQRQPSAVAPLPGVDLTTVDPVVGESITSVRTEVDDAFKDMRRFHNMEPDEVFRLISGHSARLAEIRGRIQRVENTQRQWQPIRTREVEPALDELMKQYQIASRQLTVRELDWKMEVGKT